MKNWLFFSLLFICIVVFPVRLWAQAAPKIFFNPVKLEKKDGAYILSGSLQKDKHKETDPVPLSTISISASFYTYPKEGGAAPVLVLSAISYRSNSSLTEEEKALLLNNNFPFKGIAEDGTFHFLMSNPPLDQNTLYTVIVSFKGASGAVAEGTFRATTEKGVIPGTEESFINERSYRLLAPIPGMTLLLDPELCQAEQQANKAGQICDINAFINFLLSLAIGAAAVVLVVRIIISGYSYMTTDIPFLKAKTKGQFVEALVGLLVALSSYLILNTISPRLVSNDLKIGAVSFDVEERLALSASGYDPDSAAARGLSKEEIKNIKISYEGRRRAIKDTYAPARDRALVGINQQTRLLMTAHISMEGFYPGSMSYRTNNPGNIGNVGANTQGIPQKRTCYATLEDGIKRQYSHIANLVSGNNPSYKIGRRVNVIPSAQRYSGESWTYDGSLWQYLYIYAPESPEKRNAYLSHVISFFASEGVTITRDTKMKDIFGNNPSSIPNPTPVSCPQNA